MRRPLVIGMWAFSVGTAGCARHLEPTMVPSEALTYSTDDGWRGEIRHYPADGPAVLLVHGMGANHYNWDFRPEVSLAAWLQERGYDVWIPALRGDSDSTEPSRRARRSITFDDIAIHDIPAILDVVVASSGDAKIAWVGHSMGGMLLYTTLAQWPDRIEAGVAIASPATFPETRWEHRVLGHAGWALAGRGRLPGAAVGRWSSALFGLDTPMFGLIAERDNLAAPEANGLARVALTDVSRPMARQAASWMKAGTITRLDGTPWVDRGPDVPMLALGASVDKIVPARNVEATCALYSACEYVLLGTSTGFARDYGHVDVVLGITAAAEVYPLVGAFLDANLGGSAVEVVAR
jgi:polyhydroxyalkanoate synthase subunit PhaC